MADSDGGLPEESRNKQEIANAVIINPRSPWKIGKRSIVQNYDDLIEFGNDLFSAAKIKKPTLRQDVVIVLDNESYTQHYPNNKHFWVGEYLAGEGNITWKPFTEWLIGFRDRGGLWEGVGETFITRFKAIQIDTYQGVPIVVPDPNVDHTRPIVQAEATTSTTTGITVITKTTADPRAAGVVTESLTVPAAVSTPTTFTAAERKWLGNADPTDPFILARMRSAVGNVGPTVINPNLAAAVKATTGIDPCLPNNPSASRSGGSGSTPPASISAAASALKGAIADAAAPVTSAVNTAIQTAPSTVTQQPSTPTSANSNSLAPAASTPSVYIYEPIKPGFDRYDVNSGKKVFTPNSGPSKNALGKPVSPQSTPRVSPTANNAQ